MYDRRAARGPRGARAALVAGGSVLAAAVVLLTMAACGSSGGHPTADGSSASRTSSPASPVPTTSLPYASPVTVAPSPTDPVTPLAAASPTAVKRSIVRPAGAKIVDVNTCTSVISGFVGPQINNDILTSPDRAIQVADLQAFTKVSRTLLREVDKAIQIFRRDGYPAGFPVVADLEAYRTVYTKIRNAADTGDIDAVPAIAVELNRTEAQYLADTHAQHGRAQVCQGNNG